MLTEAIPGSLWQIKGIYATRKLVALITLEKIAFNKFSDQELAQINEAVEKVSEAWDFIKDTELAASGWHILMNRGVAYKVLGKIDKADWDLEEAFRLSNKFEAFRNLALHYLETGRAEKGLALMDSMNGKWSDETDEFEYKILYARFEVVQGKADVAIETLLPLLTDEQNEHNLRLLDLITLVYFQYGAYGKALPYALKMIERYSDVSNGYLAAGICYSRIGEIENALIHLGKAFDFAENSPQTALNIFQIAEEYYGLKQYEKAASCFEKILNGDNYNVTFKNLILSYFYGNELEKCITLCIRASTLSPGNPLVAEVLFRAYDELGEYKKAEDVLSQHFTSNDVNSFDHFRLLGIQLFKKTGQNEKSLKLSLEIVAPEKLTLAQRMSISSILLENGQIDAGLEMAYEARLDNYEVSDAHVSYLQTLAIRPKDQEEYIIPEVISIDAAFIIRDAEGKERTYFLTEDKRLSGSEILRPSDSFSPKVLDKRINDTIEMQNNYGVGNILTVVSIFNKYTYAFRG